MKVCTLLSSLSQLACKAFLELDALKQMYFWAPTFLHQDIMKLKKYISYITTYTNHWNGDVFKPLRRFRPKQTTTGANIWDIYHPNTHYGNNNSSTYTTYQTPKTPTIANCNGVAKILVIYL